MSAGVAEPPAETKPAASSTQDARRIDSSKTAPSADGQTSPPGPPKSVWREYFESAVVTVIMALFGMTFVVQAVKVPTASMENTILVGDHLLVNKFIFAPGPVLPFLPQREIQRGDIIVFKYPGNKEDPDEDRNPTNIPYKTNYVKRVIGLPGDRVEVRGTQVFINGQPLPEHRIAIEKTSSEAPLTVLNDPPRAANEPYSVYHPIEMLQSPHDFGERHGFKYAVGRPVTVPPGHYFVMGDNRNDSSDSRVWGFVPRDLVIGRAMFVYWSYDESAPSSGNFLKDFFLNTRWSRTGTMIK
jgi:signal peptidase I